MAEEKYKYNYIKFNLFIATINKRIFLINLIYRSFSTVFIIRIHICILFVLSVYICVYIFNINVSSYTRHENYRTGWKNVQFAKLIRSDESATASGVFDAKCLRPHKFNTVSLMTLRVASDSVGLCSTITIQLTMMAFGMCNLE